MIIYHIARGRSWKRIHVLCERTCFHYLAEVDIPSIYPIARGKLEFHVFWKWQHDNTPGTIPSVVISFGRTCTWLEGREAKRSIQSSMWILIIRVDYVIIPKCTLLLRYVRTSQQRNTPQERDCQPKQQVGHHTLDIYLRSLIQWCPSQTQHMSSEQACPYPRRKILLAYSLMESDIFWRHTGL